MKIGVDASAIHEFKTGVGTYSEELLKGLIEVRADDEFILYTFREKESLQVFNQFPNVRIKSSSFLSFSEALWSQTTLPFLCRKDTLDFFWGLTQSVPLFLSNKVRALLTVHDLAYHLFPQTLTPVRRLFLKNFSKSLFKKARGGILSISNGTESRLHNLFRINVGAVLPPPIKEGLKKYSEEELASWLRTQDLSYRNFLLFVGTFEPRKNLELLLGTYIKLLKSFPNCHVPPLVCIGNRSRASKKLKELLIQAKKFEQIKILPFPPNAILNRFLASAKCLVFPSMYEGYGIPIAEARFLGTPTLCRDTLETKEAAENDAIFFTDETFEKLLKQVLFDEKLKLPKPTFYASRKAVAEKLSLLMDVLSIHYRKPA